MSHHATIRSESFTFADLRERLAKRNEETSGDQLAGIAARAGLNLRGHNVDRRLATWLAGAY